MERNNQGSEGERGEHKRSERSRYCMNAFLALPDIPWNKVLASMYVHSTNYDCTCTQMPKSTFALR